MSKWPYGPNAATLRKTGMARSGFLIFTAKRPRWDFILEIQLASLCPSGAHFQSGSFPPIQ